MAFLDSNNDCMVIGKEFKKANDAFTTSDGKEVKANPDRWYLYLAVGKMRKSEDLFKEKPVISQVQVKEKTFDEICEFTRTDCRFRINTNFPTAYKFYSVNGIEILDGIEEDED